MCIFHPPRTLWAPLREGLFPENHGSWWFGLEIDQFHLVPQRMTGLRQGKIKETKKCWNSNCSWRMTLRSSDKWYPSEWRNSRTQDAGQTYCREEANSDSMLATVLLTCFLVLLLLQSYIIACLRNTAPCLTANPKRLCSAHREIVWPCLLVNS